MGERIRVFTVVSSLVAAFFIAPVAVAGCSVTAGAATPVGATSCPGVRPGALVETPKAAEGDTFCTLGFVYRDKKYWYITTAGHCVVQGIDTAHPGPDSVKTWRSGTGPVALDANGKTIGRYVLGAEKQKDGIDFGLIQLSVKPNAAMCHFGGPTGTSTSRSTGPTAIEWYGNADVIGLALPARTGVVPSLASTSQLLAIGPSLTGDSGSPVIIRSNGQALGYIVAVGGGFSLANPTAPEVGNFFIDRLGPSISLANKTLHTSLVLQTSKTL